MARIPIDAGSFMAANAFAAGCVRAFGTKPSTNRRLSAQTEGLARSGNAWAVQPTSWRNFRRDLPACIVPLIGVWRSSTMTSNGDGPVSFSRALAKAAEDSTQGEPGDVIAWPCLCLGSRLLRRPRNRSCAARLG